MEELDMLRTGNRRGRTSRMKCPEVTSLQVELQSQNDADLFSDLSLHCLASLQSASPVNASIQRRSCGPLEARRSRFHLELSWRKEDCLVLCVLEEGCLESILCRCSVVVQIDTVVDVFLPLDVIEQKIVVDRLRP